MQRVMKYANLCLIKLKFGTVKWMVIFMKLISEIKHIHFLKQEYL